LDAQVETAAPLFQIYSPAVVANDRDREEIQGLGDNPERTNRIARLMLEELRELDRSRVRIALRAPAFIEHQSRLAPSALAP